MSKNISCNRCWKRCDDVFFLSQACGHVFCLNHGHEVIQNHRCMQCGKNIPPEYIRKISSEDMGNIDVEKMTLQDPSWLARLLTNSLRFWKLQDKLKYKSIAQQPNDYNLQEEKYNQRMKELQTKIEHKELEAQKWRELYENQRQSIETTQRPASSRLNHRVMDMRQSSPMITSTPLSGHRKHASSFFHHQRGHTPSASGTQPEMSRGHTPYRSYTNRPSSSTSVHQRRYTYGRRKISTPLPKVYSSKSNKGSALGGPAPLSRQLTPRRYTSSQRISLIPRR